MHATEELTVYAQYLELNPLILSILRYLDLYLELSVMGATTSVAPRSATLLPLYR